MQRLSGARGRDGGETESKVERRRDGKREGRERESCRHTGQK